MPPVRLGPRDLLEYDARYRVLICRECQYAIQKSALKSHLLRHKFYRDERHRLLKSISEFDLLEPEDVSLPTPGSSPIEALPVICGHRCAVRDCGNLCASDKRMRRHQSEAHGITKPSDLSVSFSPVKLQTFFRGTKLRYFEVTVSENLSHQSSPVVRETESNAHHNAHRVEQHFEHFPNQEQTISPPSSPSIPNLKSVRSSTGDIDLEMISYYHNYITATCLTLPRADSPQLSTHYWQVVVISQALSKQWLMSGLLAISAYHLARVGNDEAAAHVHRRRAAKLTNDFSLGIEETQQHTDSVLANADDADAADAGQQISRVLCCIRYSMFGTVSLTGNLFNQGIAPPLMAGAQLLSIMKTIQELSSLVVNSDSEGIEHNLKKAQEKAFKQASKTSKEPTTNKELRAVLDHLGQLPFDISNAIERSDDIQIIMTSFYSVAILTECCAISFAADEPDVVWRGMATWLVKIPDRFKEVISLGSPAALIILAYWIAYLVRRAENNGCWFLKGSNRMMLLQISDRLAQEGHAVQHLIPDLEHGYHNPNFCYNEHGIMPYFTPLTASTRGDLYANKSSCFEIDPAVYARKKALALAEMLSEKEGYHRSKKDQWCSEHEGMRGLRTMGNATQVAMIGYS